MGVLVRRGLDVSFCGRLDFELFEGLFCVLYIVLLLAI